MRTRGKPLPAIDETVRQIKECSQSEPVADASSIVGPDPKKITEDRLIPSGVTLLNCACSGNPKGGFALGAINTIPGESASGKSILMTTMLAACAIDRRFDDYELVLDDSEQAFAFDLAYLFPPLVGRMKFPKYDGDEGLPSETIQDFQTAILRRCRNKEKFIYILDSLDTLSSTEEMEREYKAAIKAAKSSEAVEELKGSYKTEKAKHIGELFRMINSYLKHSDSALFVVQQIRQRIGKGFGQTDWVTSGGNAPMFYSFHRIFLDAGASHYAESRNIKHRIGGHIRVKVVKNRLTGKRRNVEFDIYEDLGIDDVGACVDFLKRTGHWKTEGAYLSAPEFLGDGQKAFRKDLIKVIESEDGGLDELAHITGQVWNEIEDDMRLKDRRRRF